VTKMFSIIGQYISDITTFYAEINRVFMAEEDWQLVPSLDALNDLFYGGYGAIKGQEPVRIVWYDIAASRSALGVETTRAFLTKKLQRPGRFNVDVISQQLNALQCGTGQTYFDIVLEIIGNHQNIELVAA
jgi:RNAse (barnase) inhibitor barstar